MAGKRESVKIMWTQELVELLIAKYQQYELLYNTSHANYADRVKRSNALFEICEDLKELNVDINEEAVKKKIHTLRSQYVKELQKIAKSKKSGADADDVYEPKLWCFSQLQFLETFCSVGGADSNSPRKENPATTTEELDMVMASPSISFCSPNMSSVSLLSSSDEEVPTKRKRETKSGKLEGIREKLLHKKLDHTQKFKWLGEEVVSQLNYIKDKKIQQRTIWKIQDALREGILEDENNGDL